MLAVAAEPASAEQPVETPKPLVVDVVGLDDASVREALALRLGDRPLLDANDPRPDVPIAYAIVRHEARQLRLTLILADGNAYDRDVDDVPGQSARAAAGALVTLLHAVETGSVEPTRTDVPIPEPVVETPKPEPAPAPPPAPKAEPPPPPKPPSKPKPEPPIVELGPTITPFVGLGIAPTGPAPALTGAGGSIALDVRARSGGAASIEVRAIGRTAAGLGLVRTRFALGGGYVLRRGAFELPILARVFVEPWWLRSNGANAPLVYGSSSASYLPLLGAGLRLSPGVLIEPRREGQPSIHVGARIDIDGSFVPHDGAHSVRIAVEQPGGITHAARLGGLELGLGLDITFWFPVRRR
jgi:hypothetical protein